jgi:hypothetical protein
MNNKTKFKVGDRVKRINYIDGVWSELCYYNNLDKHGIHTVTFVSEDIDNGVGIENMIDLSCTGRANFTFDALCFELVEPSIDDSFIAVVMKDKVVINDISYPAALINKIANTLNSIQ